MRKKEGEKRMSDSEVLQDISDDLRYLIRTTVPNSVYKSENDPDPGGGGGGGGNALICNVEVQSETYTLDKTAGEIITAFESGTLVIFKLSSGDTYECELPTMYGFADSYYFSTYSYTYYADTLDDYPVYNGS